MRENYFHSLPVNSSINLELIEQNFLMLLHVSNRFRCNGTVVLNILYLKNSPNKWKIWKDRSSFETLC